MLFPDWLNNEFLPENRHRLREAHRFMTEELKKLDIPFLHRSAGFFIWADLSKVSTFRTDFCKLLFFESVKFRQFLYDVCVVSE